MIRRTWYSPIKYKSNLDSQYEIEHSNTPKHATDYSTINSTLFTFPPILAALDF